MPRKKKTPAAVARKDALKMIAKGTVPPYKVLAKKWGISNQMVGYVLRTARQSQGLPTGRRAGRPAAAKNREDAGTEVLQTIAVASGTVKSRLEELDRALATVPNLGPKELRLVQRKAETVVWAGFHTTLTEVLGTVSKLAGRTGGRRRGRRK